VYKPVDGSGVQRENEVNKREILAAVVASIVVSISILIASLSIVSGSVFDAIKHAGLWLLIAEEFGWYMAAAFLGGILTVAITKRQPRGQ
jgi:hypothetical protein